MSPSESCDKDRKPHMGWITSQCGQDLLSLQSVSASSAEDKMENTFISLFTRGGSELVAIVGMKHPKVSVGGATDAVIHSIEDVIYFLEDNLEDMYDALMRKAVM